MYIYVYIFVRVCLHFLPCLSCSSMILVAGLASGVLNLICDVYIVVSSVYYGNGAATDVHLVVYHASCLFKSVW